VDLSPGSPSTYTTSAPPPLGSNTPTMWCQLCGVRTARDEMVFSARF